MSEVTSYAPGTPCWVELTTRDLEAARDFYGAVLGWAFNIGPAETGHYTTCTTRGRNVAALSGMPPAQDVPVAWTTYLATDDVDAAAARVVDAGGRVMLAPMDVMAFGRMAIAADPAGAAFGLWQANEHIGAELVNEAGAVVWNELSTPDLERAERFYGAVFGHRFAPMDTGPGGPEYRTLHLDGDRPVAGAMRVGDLPDADGPGWSVCFGVPDADATVATAGDRGAQLTVPATDSPYGRYAVLRDPQGAAFAVLGTAETG